MLNFGTNKYNEEALSGTKSAVGLRGVAGDGSRVVWNCLLSQIKKRQ